MNTPIDLRSDTVTRPTAAMRAAMAAADVGDDQYGEDVSTNRLQERCAALLGKEAALWLPSGTMANQVALRVLTRPGDEVVTSREAHAGWHETGGAAANAGVQLHEVGTGGVFTQAAFEAAIKPRGLPVFPPTTLVQIENTHNRAGGIVFPQAEAERICAAARSRGIATFLDGARLWNASVVSGRSVAELAAPFDLVAVAFSKGLGAPGGSLLAGRHELINLANRHRRMLGGAMRQTGHYAAAALYGLDHHLARLADDHRHARLLAEALAGCPAVHLDLATVQTNIVVFHLAEGAPDAATVVARAREQGVLLNAFGARTVRAVTHLDVSEAQVRAAAERLREALG
ncbi:MAG: aminotransferase class I/II-fold pyridoxal phosphate-dependent enzyme [Rubrivivax sp.]|nr:aminotransferase class I/II-fold pyridoxal phosphate-dependent enzyme [Rubrivivax sp.]